MCDSNDMSETLTIRLPADEKLRWQKAAAAVRESVAEYVRKAVRERAETEEKSPWDKHLGSVDVEISSPTNENIRRSSRDRAAKK